MSARIPIPLEGQLACLEDPFDVPELLLAVCDMGETGWIEFRRGNTEKKVFLRDGEIVFASSSSPDDRLGVYLLSRCELSLADLRRLSPFVQLGVRLGTLLVKEGLLAPDGLVFILI